MKHDETTIEYVNTTDIKTHQLFKELFPVGAKIREVILSSMKKHGFDKSQPLVVWEKGNILLDGHTRLSAAIEAGIDKIPVIKVNVADEDEAIEYMYRLQFHRRNIKDGELIGLIVRELDRYKDKGGKGSRAEYLAFKFTGLSIAKAKQILVILKNATEEQLAELREDKISINSLYLQVKNYDGRERPIKSHNQEYNTASNKSEKSELHLIYSEDLKLRAVMVTLSLYQENTVYMCSSSLKGIGIDGKYKVLTSSTRSEDISEAIATETSEVDGKLDLFKINDNERNELNDWFITFIGNSAGSVSSGISRDNEADTFTEPELIPEVIKVSPEGQVIPEIAIKNGAIFRGNLKILTLHEEPEQAGSELAEYILKAIKSYFSK